MAMVPQQRYMQTCGIPATPDPYRALGSRRRGSGKKYKSEGSPPMLGGHQIQNAVGPEPSKEDKDRNRNDRDDDQSVLYEHH